METTNTTTEKTSTCCPVLQGGRLHASLALVLLLLAAFLFAQTIKSFKEYRYVGGGISPSNAITVSGDGEVFAVPDTAEFTFSVIEEADTAKEVQDIATVKANAAIDALKVEGIEESDIKTINYSLSPKYEWKAAASCLGYNCPKNGEQVGFTINQSMRVKVRDLDRAGELLELVTGKEVASVSGLNFTVADEDSLRSEARKKAIDEAREKAEVLANDLGVSLVRIVGFSEGGNYSMPMYARSMEASFDMAVGVMEESVSVPAGENKITSEVNITYEIR